jgi:tetratricopeptide (TPR) repeat protein
VSLCATLLLALVAAPEAEDAFGLGVEAYRRGDYAEAEAHWLVALETPRPPEETARIAFDLGNAAWRKGEPLVAVGWYQVALRHAPRDRDVWHNLELARASAGLEPVDRGDLRDTVERLLTSLRPEEARLLALLGLLPLACAFLGEALRGGRTWRRAIWAGVLFALFAAAPWVRGSLPGPSDPLLVVRAPTVGLRSEPRTALEPIARVDAGEEVERIDALPGWVRIRTADGTRGWLQEDAVFTLSRGAGGVRAPGPSGG